jgi:hypothetical protein
MAKQKSPPPPAAPIPLKPGAKDKEDWRDMAHQILAAGSRTSIENSGAYRVELDPAKRRQLLLNMLEGNRKQRKLIAKARRDKAGKTKLKGLFGGGE